MRGAEQVLIDRGVTVEALMQIAGRGAAEWVRRIAAGQSVTVLCGPGNNGGDGYVIAEALREAGGDVVAIAPVEPVGVAAKEARELYLGEVLGTDARHGGAVLVDCLFGVGLSRPLEGDHVALLQRLAASHQFHIAVDLPSGIHADTGERLNEGLPSCDLTLALGAWKPAHFLMPSASAMGALRLVPIGIEAVADAARLIGQPTLLAPARDAHKYSRGLLAIVAGTMPGAAMIAARAAQGGGAGYVKLIGADHSGYANVPADLVVVAGDLDAALHDPRIDAILIGPGLGRDAAAAERLAQVLARSSPLVLDADALMLLDSHAVAQHASPIIATPHEGELKTLEQAFGTPGIGPKSERAQTLARTSGMVIVAKGADTIVAAPDGRIGFAPATSSWLSTAGTGDALAGTIASRLATGIDAFSAACEGVWLHGEAARGLKPAFGAGELADAIRIAYAACL